jgi:hypothetical protein
MLRPLPHQPIDGTLRMLGPAFSRVVLQWIARWRSAHTLVAEPQSCRSIRAHSTTGTVACLRLVKWLHAGSTMCRETVSALEAEADGAAEAQGALDDLETQVLL